MYTSVPINLGSVNLEVLAPREGLLPQGTQNEHLYTSDSDITLIDKQKGVIILTRIIYSDHEKGIFFYNEGENVDTQFIY